MILLLLLLDVLIIIILFSCSLRFFFSSSSCCSCSCCCCCSSSSSSSSSSSTPTSKSSPFWTSSSTISFFVEAIASTKNYCNFNTNLLWSSSFNNVHSSLVNPLCDSSSSNFVVKLFIFTSFTDDVFPASKSLILTIFC